MPAVNGPQDPAPADEPVPGGLVPLERRVLRLWRIRTAPVVAGAALLAGWLVGTAVGAVQGVVVGVVVLGAAGAGAAWWTALVWRAWRFRVDDDALHLRRGVLTRHESTIPYHRIQHIDLEAGPLERRLGLTSLVLRTAAASTDATVPGIATAEAEVLRGRILALVGSGDAL